MRHIRGRLQKAADEKVTEYKNAWNHWVFTKNVDTGEMKMYVNGTLVGSITGATAPISGFDGGVEVPPYPPGDS